MYLLTNFITMLMIPIQQALSPFQLPCSEDTNAHAQLILRGSITYENGVLFEIKSLQSLRLSSFIIISILLDQNFAMNATRMVLESL